MNINIGLIWIGGVGLPAIAMAWAKVNNDTWVGLAVLRMKAKWFIRKE